MADVTKRADTMRILGDIVEQAESIYGCGDDIQEYVIPVECYEALVDLFANLSKGEII